MINHKRKIKITLLNQMIKTKSNLKINKSLESQKMNQMLLEKKLEIINTRITNKTK